MEQPPYPNWVEVVAVLPEAYRNWHLQFPADEVREVPPPHITLLYGFDPAQFPNVQADVDAFGLGPADWSFPHRPRPGNKDQKAWLLPVESPRLQKLFWQLHARYPNRHYLHEGRFDPHITLCYMTRDIVP